MGARNGRFDIGVFAIMVLPFFRENKEFPFTNAELKSPFLTEEELRLIGLSVSENFTDEDYKNMTSWLRDDGTARARVGQQLVIELEKEEKNDVVR